MNTNTAELRLAIKKYQVPNSEGLPVVILVSIHKSLEEFWMLGFAKCLEKKLSKMEATRRWLHCLKEYPVSKLLETQMSSNWGCNDSTSGDTLISQRWVTRDWVLQQSRNSLWQGFWSCFPWQTSTCPPNRKGKKEFMLQAVFCLPVPLQLFLHRSFGTATNLAECTIYNNHYPLSSVCDEWFYGMEFDSRICSSNWPFQLSQIAKSGSELKNVSEINISTEERKPC